MSEQSQSAPLSEWDAFEVWWSKNGAGAEPEFPGDFPFIAFKMCSWSAWNARAKAPVSDTVASQDAAVIVNNLRSKWEKRLGAGGEFWDGYNSFAEEAIRALKKAAPQGEVERSGSPAGAAPNDAAPRARARAQIDAVREAQRSSDTPSARCVVVLLSGNLRLWQEPPGVWSLYEGKRSIRYLSSLESEFVNAALAAAPVSPAPKTADDPLVFDAGEDHYGITLPDGTYYIQRKKVGLATANPLSPQEIVIIGLCKAMLEAADALERTFERPDSHKETK